MVAGTEKLVRKFARGYERRGGSSDAYISSSDMEHFITELIGEFGGICVGIRKDRGQGIFLSVLSAEKREMLYFIRIRNTNARGLNRAPVRYTLTLENRDVILEFP